MKAKALDAPVIKMFLSAVVFLVPACFIFDCRGESFFFLVLIPVLYPLMCIQEWRPPVLLKEEQGFRWILLIVAPSLLTIGLNLTWRYGKSFVCGVILCMAMAELASSKRFLYYYLLLLASIGAFLGMDSLVQGLYGADMFAVKPFWDGRITALFSNPNDLAFFLTCMIPACFLLMDRRWIEEGGYGLAGKRAFYLASGFAVFSFLLSVTGIILAGSRSSWIALGTMIFPFFYSRDNKTKGRIFAVLGASVFIGLVLAWSVIFQRVEGLETENPRLHYWALSLPIIFGSPFLGHGLSSSSNLFPFDPHSIDTVLTFPHNFFIEIAIECGIPAMLVFCWFFYRVFNIYIFPFLRRGHGAFLLGMSVGPFIASMINMPFFSRAVSIYLWLSLGTAIGFARGAKTDG